MYNPKEFPGEPVEALFELYQKIMEDPNYDNYSKYEEEIDELYGYLRLVSLTKDDLRLLSDVQTLHEKLVHVIIKETNILNKDIKLFEKKKRISEHYGRQSNNNNIGAFFVDFKK
ncbi:hypothetical protein AWU65_07680 [Paenibacillus glucanolyticus]|uniref:Flagellar protein FliT n=1 Tax=Paenibacillus glucanolyticus TaxID=59843 RepID=A0A163I550_9BACL|nr:hypothetical protein [Paenibacillus glucanolyticus]KZS45798.1 hypothetical protein AWU65_07680 [Paenibacillus glucanolyticus]